MSIPKQFIVAAVAAGLTSSVYAQVEEIRLRIDGVTCPMCINNVEKSMQKLKGVDADAKIQSFLDKGVTVVPWSAFQAFDPAPVNTAIKDSGFTLRTIDLTATGTLPDKADAGAITLDVKASVTGEVFHLVEAERVDHQQSWDGLLAYLSEPSNDRQVRIEGRVAADTFEAPGASWKVELTSWAPEEFGAEVELKVDGFHCEKCAARTMKTLGVFDDVIHLEANHETGFVHVWTKSKNPNIDKLSARIAELGFQCTHAEAHDKGEQPHDMSDMPGMSDMHDK